MDVEDAPGLGAVRTDEVAVHVLEVGRVLVGIEGQPAAIPAPATAEGREDVAGEWGVVGAVWTHLPEVELAGLIRRLRVTLVGHDGQPGVVWAELDRVLLGGGVAGERDDLAAGNLDSIEVVLLVAVEVFGKDDEAVVAGPDEAGPQGARYLAVAELAHLAGS